MEWFIKVVKSVSFRGRARRKEYWMFVLFAIVFSLLLGLLDGLLGTYSEARGIGLLGTLFALAILVQSIAAGVRRLHDTGRSGWGLQIGFIPFVGTDRGAGVAGPARPAGREPLRRRPHAGSLMRTGVPPGPFVARRMPSFF